MDDKEKARISRRISRLLDEGRSHARVAVECWRDACRAGDQLLETVDDPEARERYGEMIDGLRNSIKLFQGI